MLWNWYPQKTRVRHSVLWESWSPCRCPWAIRQPFILVHVTLCVHHSPMCQGVFAQAEGILCLQSLSKQRLICLGEAQALFEQKLQVKHWFSGSLPYTHKHSGMVIYYWKSLSETTAEQFTGNCALKYVYILFFFNLIFWAVRTEGLKFLPQTILICSINRVYPWQAEDFNFTQPLLITVAFWLHFFYSWAKTLSPEVV